MFFHSGSLWISFSLSPDLKLGSGITVPAQSILVVPLHLVQMDASVWGDDADQFNPHRFLKKDVDLRGLSRSLFFLHFSVLRDISFMA
jgi:cytochrome P450